MTTLSVSVIIPARNAEAHLPRCLDGIDPKTATDREVIVVDDASSDATAKIAASRGARVHRLKIRMGPSAARNRGAREARGRYLFFVDADVVLAPGAVSRVRDYLDDHPDVAALFGSYDAYPMETGLLSRYRNLLHHFVHQHGKPEASTFWSGCGAIRRDVFLRLGGFDELDYPYCIEDIELGYRLRRAGHRVVLDRDLLCRHMKRWTLSSIVRTDIFCRAVPWARLELERKASPDDLNVKWSQKISVLLTLVFVFSILLGLRSDLFFAVAAAAVILVIVLNGTLFLLFWKRGGPGFAAFCVPVHLLYFFYSGLSFLYAWLAFRMKAPIRDGNRLSEMERKRRRER